MYRTRLHCFQARDLVLMAVVALMATSQCCAELPCPDNCECYEENYEPHGTVNTIVCSGLGLTAIPDLTSLKGSKVPNNLQLNRNEIKAISKKDFPPGLNIIILDLSENRGIQIESNAFLNMGYSLKKLSIEAADIVFDKTLVIFDSLFSLEELSLDNNNKSPYTKGAVQSVDAVLFQGEVAKRLKKLQLAYCTMRSMSEDSLKSLVSLEDLNLSNNWFSAVPHSIRPLFNLRSLKLFYCNIASLQDNDFRGLTKLGELDVSSNKQLKEISDNALDGCEDSLRKLKLQRCSLTKVPTKALQNLNKLTELDLSENDFRNIDSGAFVGSYKLDTLQISSKTLQFNSGMFTGQERNIANLYLPRMNLKTIPHQTLKQLTTLKDLHLEYNNITTLPSGAFDGLSVEGIYLSHNPLTAIQPGAFSGLPEDLYINLARTKMKNIDFLMDYQESTIDTINLAHNDLQCTCDMKSFLNVTLRMHIYGECLVKNKTVYINRDSLGPLLDKVCHYENNNNPGLIPTSAIILCIAATLFINFVLSNFVD